MWQGRKGPVGEKATFQSKGLLAQRPWCGVSRPKNVLGRQEQRPEHEGQPGAGDLWVQIPTVCRKERSKAACVCVEKVSLCLLSQGVGHQTCQA